jgi:hypothetical protein
VRFPMPAIRDQLRKQLESREALAATRVVTESDQFVVVTLVPRPAARLFGNGRAAVWETRVYVAPSFGIGTQPHYVVLDADREAALVRHETLLGRLERAAFLQETSREILQTIRPAIERAAQALRNSDARMALAVLEEALRVAGRLDAVRRFLHLYAEVFLMRALTMEKSDTVAAQAAYRELIALHAEYPLHHPDTQRAVAQAREAVERLTPVPFGQ